MLLVKFDKNWADEFDVYGFKLMTPEQYAELIDNVDKLTFSFGTNEGWDEQGDFDASDFTAKELTALDESALILLFPELKYGSSGCYGHFPDWEQIKYDMQWEEDAEDYV